MGQLAYYRALEQQGQARIITDLAGLDQHMAQWAAWEVGASPDPEQGPPLGLVLSMEGADPILHPDQLQSWWDAGLRLMGLTHYGPGRYAGGTGVESGLTPLGVDLLAQMARLGVILDLTHCSDLAFWQALDGFDGPVLASHSNCRALVPHQRQFSDEQLRAIIQREGVVGIACDAIMLAPGYVIGQSSNRRVSLAMVADHVDHLCQLAGSSRHAAIGSVLDGGFGRDQSPRDLDTIADLQKLEGLLAGRGYGQADIAAILHGNWLRLLRRGWGGR
jgi:membrane dipeptidase